MRVLERVERFGDVERVHVATPAPGLGTPLYWVSYYRTGRVLVDSGHVRGRGVLDRTLRDHDITVAFATHEHEDHVGNAGLLAERRIPLYAPESAVDLLQRVRDGRTKRLPPYRALTWGQHDGSPDGRSVWTLAGAAGQHDGSDAARVANGAVKADGRRFTLIPTPGHSVDHVCLLDESSGALFAGDAVLGKLKVMRAVEDAPAWLESLRDIRDKDPRIVLPAHGPVLKDPKPRLDEMIAHLANLQKRAHALAARGRSERAITRELLGPEAGLSYVSGFEFSKKNLVRSLLSKPPA